jgi:hypothetical protein
VYPSMFPSDSLRPSDIPSFYPTSLLLSTEHKFQREITNYNIFEGKAIVATDVDSRKWAFAASTALIDTTMNSFPKRKMLLVGLKSFTGRDNDATEIDFAKEYHSGYSIEVKDMHFDLENEEFIFCGEMKQTINSETVGFVIRANSEGNPTKGMSYTSVSSFESIIPWNDGLGYIAVGRSQSIDGIEYATFMSIQRSFLLPVCGRDMVGESGDDPAFSTATFNQVIQYTFDSNELFAAVGETAVDDAGMSNCESRSDVLVVVANKDCKVEWKNRYGDTADNVGDLLNERGLSIAQFSGNDGRLVITGSTTLLKEESTPTTYSCETEFDAILTFTVNASGTPIWYRYYGIKQENVSKKSSMVYFYCRFYFRLSMCFARAAFVPSPSSHAKFHDFYISPAHRSYWYGSADVIRR